MVFRRPSENITVNLLFQYHIVRHRWRMRPFVEATANWQETNAIANKQCFAPNLLYIKLIKCNQRNWSCFKQTLKKSPHKPSTSYTIDQFEKRSDWCRKADGRAEPQQTTNSAMQLYFCVKFLNTIKLFLDTPVQDKREDIK